MDTASQKLFKVIIYVSDISKEKKGTNVRESKIDTVKGG